jgi:signal transduction histidine kinase
VLCNAISRLGRDLRLEGDDRKLLDMAAEEAQRLHHIVRNFLSYARFPRKVTGPLDMNQLVEDVVFLVEHDRRVGPKVRIEKALSRNLEPVVGDEHQVQEIIFNLLTNALDAVGDRGVVWVRTRHAAAEGGRAVELEVSDDGCGIKDTDKRHLFKPFFSTKPDGIGIGLAIVQRIVEQHGGTISVESQPGRGATFTVILPAEGGGHE